jgi:perosamine synthetase
VRIPVYQAHVPPESIAYANDAVSSGRLSRGRYNKIASERLQELIGVRHVLLTNTGTAATHLVAAALGQRNVSSVIMPDNVYVAAWNAFRYDGSPFEIEVIPSNIDTWNFDHGLLSDAVSSDQKAAICVVHNLGNVVNVPSLQRKLPNTHIVEDACEGFLGSYEGRPVGSAALASSISFFGNKNVTCGEGGAFLTNDTDLFEYAERLHGQGVTSQRFVHDILGHNYRMPNVQAAILCGQLENLDSIVESKARVFGMYESRLKDRPGVVLQKTDAGTQGSNWMFGVRVLGGTYQDIEKHFDKNGIEVRPMFCPISWHKHLGFEQRETPSTLLRKECVVLPSYPQLESDDINRIVGVLDDYTRTLPS